jgi:molybdopterin-guanine dinucleotide biosynthesis protein A
MQVSILCGGKSSRMQSEKGLVLYRSKPFIQHIIEALLPISNNIQLVTNGNQYDYLGYKIVKDRIENKGPLGGIYSALFHSDSEINLILSCDIPLISTEILSELIQKRIVDFDITVFKDLDKVHPLIGIYSNRLLPVLEKALDESKLKMMDFISKNKHQLILIEEKNKQLFRNINSLEELKELELI